MQVMSVPTSPITTAVCSEGYGRGGIGTTVTVTVGSCC